MNDINKILEGLNEEQKEAVISPANRTLIIAGAGTGKTQTLMSKVAYLVSKGVDPKSILLLTFTNKAADEMKDRAIRLAGKTCEDITAMTYHSFCYNMIRKFNKIAKLPKDFKVLSENDAEDVISFIRTSKPNYKVKSLTTKKIISIHSSSINTERDINDIAFENGLTDDDIMILKQILEDYEEYKLTHFMLDFDDLMTWFLGILFNDDVRNQISNTYKYILIDEFQDTNNLQMRIVDKMLNEDSFLTVVGDDNQSIYKFRGSNLQNFLEFEKNYAPVHKITLVKNYRSTEEILNASNTIMSNARKSYYDEGYEKNLYSDKHGSMPYIYSSRTQGSEVSDIMNEIYGLKRNGKSNKDIAVIFRNSNSIYGLEAALTRAKFPYVKYGGTKFFDLKEVRDLLAFQKITLNHNDETQWFRILDLLPSIGDVRGRRIAEKCAEDDFLLHSEYEGKTTKTAIEAINYLTTLHNFIKEIYETGDFHEQFDKIGEIYVKLLEIRLEAEQKKYDEGKKVKEETLEDYRTRITKSKEEIIPAIKDMLIEYNSLSTWLSDSALNDNLRNKEEGLTLTTIHSAKGLEWDSVIVIDVADGIFPRNINDKEDLKEELRCFYVAITRAKTHLTIYTPSIVKIKGENVATGSIFLNGCKDVFKVICGN